MGQAESAEVKKDEDKDMTSDQCRMKSLVTNLKELGATVAAIREDHTGSMDSVQPAVSGHLSAEPWAGYNKSKEKNTFT